MNSDMVKPETFGHLHLVYHFTVPLNLNYGTTKQANNVKVANGGIYQNL